MVSLQATPQNHWPGCANKAHLRWTFFGKLISTPVFSGQETKVCGHEPPAEAGVHPSPLLSICPFRTPAHLQLQRSGTRNCAILTLPIAVLMPPGSSRPCWLPDTLCDMCNENRTVNCVPGSRLVTVPCSWGGCTHTQSLFITILSCCFSNNRIVNDTERLPYPSECEKP